MLPYEDSLTYLLYEKGWENYFSAFLKNNFLPEGAEGGEQQEGSVRDCDMVLAALFDHSPVGMVVITPDDRLVLINRAAEQLLDFNRVIMRSARWADIRVIKDLRLHDDTPLTEEQDPLYVALREKRRNTLSMLVKSRDMAYEDYVSVTAFPVIGRDGSVVAAIASMLDITDFKDMQDILYFHATHDVLTGLSNRALLYGSLPKTLARAKRNMMGGAIMVIDIDNFKNINDVMGHEAGDELLVKIAKRLRAEVRETDIVARLGGDEFAILLPDIAEQGDKAPIAGEIAARICDSISEPFIIKGNAVEITASVGISLFPKDGEDEKSLMNKADAAMYQVKVGGKNSWKFWENPA